MSTPAQEKLADSLTGTSIAAGGGVSLIDLNLYLETGTLVIGLLAGLFALFFHVRRWYRGRQLDRAAKDKSGEN